MILQVLPIIIPHTNDGCNCASLPQWVEIGVWIFVGLTLLGSVILLIKLIFDL